MTIKKPIFVAIFFVMEIAYANPVISPYNAVSSSNPAYKFNIGEWRAAEKIISKVEMNETTSNIANWNKDDWIYKFCSGLGKTYKQNFVQKDFSNMEYTISDFGGKGSVIGCVFSWKTPKGHSFKIINLIEKGPDNVMYMLAMFS